MINSRISEVISANRKNPRLVIGSREWWRNVDFVSQRRNSTFVNLDSDSLNDLNDFLLCWALMMPPSDVVIAADVEIPQIFERQAWNIWNLALTTHSWPTSWKRANINPLPKVEVPKENLH